MAGWRRLHGWEAGPTALVLAGMALFVAVVYVVVVRGGGALIGQTNSPDLALSVLATAIVALGFEPVRRWLRPVATRFARGERAAPYQVLTRFPTEVTGVYATDEVPIRMAELLAAATGARYAQVWLFVNGKLVPAATWPPGVADEPSLSPAPDDAPPDPTSPARDDDVPPDPTSPARDDDVLPDPTSPARDDDVLPDPTSAARDDAPPDPTTRARGRRVLAVRHGGELLGVLVVQERDRQPLTPTEDKLFAGLAAQAGLVLRAVRLRAELAARLKESSERAAELRASRERIVAAQDEERRRLERNIHDGAQQHLVALAVNLRLAQTLITRSPERAPPVLAQLRTAAEETIDTLSELSRGIYPRLLSDVGLPAALEAAVGAGSMPVELCVDDIGRPPPDVEATLYFCCLEALQNAAKHSHAARVVVRVRRVGQGVELNVSDDGDGFAPLSVAAGSGLANLRDRAESAGGSLSVESQPGRGTVIAVRVPTALVATGGA